MRRVLPGMLIVVLLAGACSKEDSPTSPTSPTPAAVSPTTVAFTSDPASSVGRGESPTYTVLNATFQVATDSQFVSVGVVPQGASEVKWRFVLHPPRGQKLVAGTFPIAAVGPNTGHGFEFSGGSNRCSSGSGTLTIEQILNAGIVERLSANFSISCDRTPAVNGRIVLNWVAGVGYR